jgi:hypothetical protein
MLSSSWLYPIDIECLAMCTKSAAVTTAKNCTTNFIYVEVTPVSVWTIGWRFHIIWGVLNASLVPNIQLFYTEIVDCTPKDLDAYFREDAAMIVIRDKEPTPRKRSAD